MSGTTERPALDRDGSVGHRSLAVVGRPRDRSSVEVNQRPPCPDQLAVAADLPRAESRAVRHGVAPVSPRVVGHLARRAVGPSGADVDLGPAAVGADLVQHRRQGEGGVDDPRTEQPRVGVPCVDDGGPGRESEPSGLPLAVQLVDCEAPEVQRGRGGVRPFAGGPVRESDGRVTSRLERYGGQGLDVAAPSFRILAPRRKLV
mmetsp:Transcript_38104/g.91180  ORF Transcript_38104/g.91180 Transcript_38104/m.91180 type:complete len:203 (+) Transcript_38104:1106-1714(+)